jgi:hypothetical protein
MEAARLREACISQIRTLLGSIAPRRRLAPGRRNELLLMIASLHHLMFQVIACDTAAVQSRFAPSKRQPSEHPRLRHGSGLDPNVLACSSHGLSNG